jgi:hypothetical protein
MILLNILEERELGGEFSIYPLKLSRSAIGEELLSVYRYFYGLISVLKLMKEETSSWVLPASKKADAA